MDRKIRVLALISIVAAAAVGAAVVIALQSTVKADFTASVTQDTQPVLSSINATNNNCFIGGYMGFEGPKGTGRSFGGGFRGFERGFSAFGGNFFNRTVGGFGSIRVSSAFTENMINILNSSTDVEALLSQGYNVTSIRPVINTTIIGIGNVVI